MITTRGNQGWSGFLRELGGLLLGLAVGLALGLTAWYLLARYLEVWRYDQSLVSTGFLLTLAVFGYATPEVGDRVWGWLRPPPADAPKPRGRRWLKTVKIFLGAIVLPLAALMAANQVSLSGKAPAFVPPPNAEYQYAAQMADAVLASHSPAARVAGIEALQALPAHDATDRLANIFDQDATILNDAGTYAALAAALAGEGTEAKPWLLRTFAAHAKSAEAAAGAAPDGGLYEYYFQQPFAALRQDLTNSTSDPAAQAALQLELTAAEAQLKSGLEAVEAKQPALARDALALDFVLDTFGQMTLSDDPDIYRLARGAAGDTAYPASTRRRAIRLVGKFGSSADFDFLLKSLQDNDESIREAAFAALQTLYHKTHH